MWEMNDLYVPLINGGPRVGTISVLVSARTRQRTGEKKIHRVGARREPVYRFCYNLSSGSVRLE